MIIDYTLRKISNVFSLCLRGAFFSFAHLGYKRQFLKFMVAGLTTVILTACGGAVDGTGGDGTIPDKPDDTIPTVTQLDTSDVAAAFEKSCGSCHGDTTGDAVSVAAAGALTPANCTTCTQGFTSLQNLIADTMPVEGGGVEPASCVGQCATDLADYILDNFDGYADVALNTGEGLYKGYCVECHGDPSKNIVGIFPALNKGTCGTCGTATNFIAKTIRSDTGMPRNNKAACGTDCATKIYDYMTSNFPSFQDAPPVDRAKNLASPKGFELNGNTLSWDALATTPDYWIIDGWSSKDAVWASVARVAAGRTSHTVTGASYGKYRLYAVTNKIASVPSLTAQPGIFISTSGQDIWAATDRAHFSYTAAAGNVIAEATIESMNVSAGADLAKAGIMLRENLTGGSRQATISLTSGQGVRGLVRESNGGNIVIKGNVAGINALPVRVRLARTGTSVTLSAASGTDAYQVIDTFDVGFAGGYVGVTAAKANSSTNVEVQFSSFTVGGSAVASLTPLDLDATSTVSVSTGTAETDDSSVAINPYVDTQTMTLLNRYEYSNLLNGLFNNLNLSFDDLTGGDKSSGFEIVLGAQDQDVTAYTDSAEDFSAQVINGVQCNNKDCALARVREMAPSMIRRPLTDSFMKVLGDIYDEVNRRLDSRAAFQSVYEAVAASPSFLYRVETAGQGMDPGTMVPVTGYEMASRLSFTLWASGPDAELLQAAESGALTTPAQIKKQAERMVNDPRAKQGFASFYRQWFDLESLEEQEREAGGLVLDESLREAMLDASDAFVNKIVFDDSGTIDDFFTAPFVGNNSKIRALTGINTNSAASIVSSTAGSTRSGILGQPAVLSMHAEHFRTSIAARGNFINVELLCKPFGPTPDDIPVFDDIPTEGKSARVVFDDLTLGPDQCKSCHQYINPVGGALEAFDHFGRHRTIDVGFDNLPIDTDADVVSRITGLTDKSVDGLAELNTYLASLDSVKACFANKYLTYASHRRPSTAENASLQHLVDKAKDSQLSIKQLMIEATQTPVFLYRQQ